MIQKIILATLLSAMALFALPNDELDLALITQAAHKKNVVLSSMHLQGATKENFGNLYDEYQIKLMEHGLKKLALIGGYAKNYADMKDTQADKLLNEWIALDKALTALKSSYIVKFKKVMSSENVIRYFQIENRIGLVKQIEIANLIPLAEPASVK